ncbi:MAG: methyltransferase domain-containing protein [Myxococcota bacterium]|nr:methyltransferase domain-containing protein [Myxococcota bacterium]MEC8423377.1 methyltransferase domain-containing protein [Myxococcota bacterium]
MRVHDVSLLACPDTHHPVVFQGTNLETVLMDGVLVCVETGTSWAVEDGWPRLLREAPATSARARLDKLEDALPRLHDPVVRLLPQILGGGGDGMRARLFGLLDLDGLPEDGARVLEVGAATGMNLSPLLDALPGTAELWGTDTRVGLLGQARERAKDDPRLENVRLLLASPSALPFQDATFDRILYVGGLHGQSDPAAVMAELMRVTKPGGTIVVADERADASGGVTGWRRRALSALGATQRQTAPLAGFAPAGAADVQVESIDPVIEALVVRT